jgi:hypothetical protein
MKGLRVAIMGVTLAAALGVAGCEDGPVERFGERVDRATGQDELIGKGPGEKAGEKVDETVNEIKR